MRRQLLAAAILAFAAAGCASEPWTFTGNYACVEGEGTGSVQTATVRATTRVDAKNQIAATAERACGIGDGKVIYGAITVQTAAATYATKDARR